MRPGTKPKSTARKQLEGNPGRRPLNTREPELPLPADGFETPPRELGKDRRAIAEWRRLAPMLRRARQITEADRSALLALCMEWSRYLEARSKVRSEGLVVRSSSQNGYRIPTPYLSIAKAALAACTKLWAELGLTPSSRSRVYAELPTGGDEFSEFDVPPDVERKTAAH